MAITKRERELFRKAQYTMRKYIDLSNTAPINRQVVRDLAVLEWQLKQKYRAEGVAHYVSKKSYEEDLAKIGALESKIIEADYKAEALEAVEEAKEYLELIAGYRVRVNTKTRVY